VTQYGLPAVDGRRCLCRVHGTKTPSVATTDGFKGTRIVILRNRVVLQDCGRKHQKRLSSLKLAEGILYNAENSSGNY
jgi:hypothetical protein